VNNVSLSAIALGNASSGLAEAAAEFADELGSAPTLAEFLEIVGWALPTRSTATDGTFTEPLRFKVTLKGNKPYRSAGTSRVPELNDHLFEDAREHHAALVQAMRTASGAPITPLQFASALLQVLRSGRIILADVAPEDIRKLTAELPKKRIAKPVFGDVLAIPARNGGCHIAVVVAQNRFGCALGLFHGVSAHGRLDAGLRRSPGRYPVYTGDHLVTNGTWKIVDHDASLLALFPSDPVIYHGPNAWPGFDAGEFGAAETADGTVRLIGPDEAREVGLQDGTYRQTRLAAMLQKQLDDEADRS
jgi:hypothetical protein